MDERADAEPVEPGAPRPDLGKTKAAMAHPEARSVGVTVLAALALLYTLYFARDFLLPIAFALILDFLFSPLVRLLARWRIRPPVGAALVIVLLVGGVGFAVYELAGPMQSWVAKAPETAMKAREKLHGLIRPIVRVTETAARVEEATTQGEDPPERVVLQGPSLVSRIFGTTQRLVAGVLQVLVLLYFLLAAGDLFLQKLVKILPRVRDKEAAVHAARQTESSISTYLLTATAINAGEAAVVTGAMHLLGMPNPLLWGALVLLLEFIPYIGAAIITIVLALAALTTYDTVSQALLVPAVFILINLIQGNLVSPFLHADRLTLNPVAVFVGLTFWWWIWGIPGAFLAVPMLAVLKIVCDHVPPLATVGEFLGQRDVRERRAIIR
ncbi:MAG TPA: AI-2E family transporter [Gemmatimonadales bacterium]